MKSFRVPPGVGHLTKVQRTLNRVPDAAELGRFHQSSIVPAHPFFAARLMQEPSRAPNGSPSDREIVDGIRMGKDSAADALYDRVHAVVDRSLRRILRATGPDYDDLMQATFERIITVLSKKSLNGRCDLRAWSAAVATHVALDSLRRKMRERRLFQEETPHTTERPHDSTNAEGHLEARSEVVRLQSILARMKPHAVETLLLHDVLGYELTEVAELTGTSVAGAQSRLIRSRKELLRRVGAKVTP